MRVQFCGVRGSTPAPGIEFVRYGGHTSCVALAHDGASRPTLVLDAGTGLRQVTRLLDRSAFDGSLLLTHLHWDHVHGLPFFAGGDRADARVDVWLPEQGEGTSAEALLARGMSPPHFPISPGGLRGAWAFNFLAPGWVALEGFGVQVVEIPHKGGRTFGYRVSDGHSVLAYLPDHCPTRLGPGPDGWGEYHDAAMRLAQGVDLLIHDAQLLPEELEAESHFGHAAADYAIALGRRAGARAVALFHHRPDRTDGAIDAMVERLATCPMSVSAAAEGTVLDL